MRRGNGPATLRIVPSPQTGEEFIWDDDVRPAINYDALGRTLAARGDLFRNSGHGGLMLIAPDGTHRLITKGSDLYPVIVDRVHVRVHKDGKTKGSRIPAADLNAMLRSETFLGQFPVLDLVVSRPMYLPGFNLTEPGYNDGGPGHRIYYRGGAPEISDSLDTINKFLDVMEWDSPADRTNAVGGSIDRHAPQPLAGTEAHHPRNRHEERRRQRHGRGFRMRYGSVDPGAVSIGGLGIRARHCRGHCNCTRRRSDCHRQCAAGKKGQGDRLGVP